MTFFRGEEGSVKFKNASGTTEAIVSTRNWSLTVNKELLECTDHGDTSRAYVGGLISATGSVELLYTAASGNETENFVEDCLVAEDAGDAQFELFLDTSGTKKLSFAGIVTSTDFSANIGDLETITVSFTSNGAITSAV
tara:strand:- start:127 stop:543 length:417 start_codon:yes stop_codon:yes gene_type:complete